MSRQNSREISNINVTLNGHEVGIERSINENAPFSDVKVLLLKGADGGVIDQQQSDWSQTDTTKVDYIKNKPTLGTASALNVPSSGDASSSQVVKGDDTRLTNNRRNPQSLYVTLGGNNSLQYSGAYEKKLYIQDFIVEIPSTGWTNNPDAEGYYLNGCSFTTALNTYVRPIVSCSGADKDTDATSAQKAAYDLCEKFSFANSTQALSVTAKAKTKPTETFYISIFGFYYA